MLLAVAVTPVMTAAEAVDASVLAASSIPSDIDVAIRIVCTPQRETVLPISAGGFAFNLGAQQTLKRCQTRCGRSASTLQRINGITANRIWTSELEIILPNLEVWSCFSSEELTQAQSQLAQVRSAVQDADAEAKSGNAIVRNERLREARTLLMPRPHRS